MTHVRHSITRVLLGLLFLALAPVQVALAGITTGGWSTGYSVDWDTGVTHTSSSWNPGGAPSSGNTRWGTSNGLPSASSNGRLPVGRGFIDVQARVVPSGPSVARALLRAAKKAFVPLAVGQAIYDTFKEAGCTVSLDASSFLAMTCTETTVDGSYYVIGFPSTTASTRTQACINAQGVGAYVTQSGNAWYCFNKFGGGGYAVATNYENTVNNEVSKTEEEVEAIISAKNNWGAASKLPEALKQAADSGEPIEASSPVVTGPTSVVGPTSTTTNPDGTTVVKTENYTVNYAGNKITYQTIVTINNNGQITTEVKDSDPVRDHCDLYPDTAGCSSLDTPASDTLKTKEHAVTVTPVSFASSSVCPSPLSFTVRGSSYGVSYEPLCDRLALLKTLFLALAGVLAAFIVADSFRVT